MSDEEFKLKLSQDMGWIKGAFKAMDGKVDDLGRKVGSLEGAVQSKISSIHQSISGLVRREDCQKSMDKVHADVVGALSSVAEARATAQSAVAKADEAEMQAAVAGEQAEAAKEVTIRHQIPTGWTRVVEHSRGLTSILVVLGMLCVGFLGLAHFVNKVERSLSTSEEMNKQAQEAVMKRLMDPKMEPKTVYITLDAGVPPKRPKKR